MAGRACAGPASCSKESQPGAKRPLRPREGLGKLSFKLLLNAKPDLLIAGCNDFGRTGVVFIYRLVL